MAKKQKLLYLVTEDHYFCSHRLSLALTAKKAGYDVVVATNVGPASSKIDAAGLTLIPVHFSRRSINPFRELLIFLQIFLLYRRVKPDVVHHVALKPTIYGSIAALLTGVKKSVNTLGGLGYLFTENNLETKILRPMVKVALKLAMLKKSTQLVLQNQDDYREVSRFVPEDRLLIIPGSGVNTETFSPKRGGRKVDEVKAVLVSRMLWSKGIGELVEASKLLKAEKINVQIDLVGEVDFKNPTHIKEATLRQWKREGLVNWLGPKKNIQEIYQQSQIAVLPSYREGLPKSLLEAASCARPIITTDVPGCRDVVENDITGILVEPKDPRAIAEAIKKLVQDPELRAKLGKNARQKVLMTYDEKIINNKTIELYTHN